jgi:hypothetical protein
MPHPVAKHAAIRVEYLRMRRMVAQRSKCCRTMSETPAHAPAGGCLARCGRGPRRLRRALITSDVWRPRWLRRPQFHLTS